MADNKISCSVTAEGTVLSNPAKIKISKVDGELLLGGTIEWGGQPISNTLTFLEDKDPGSIGGYVDALLPDCAPKELFYFYHKNKMLVSVKDKMTHFRLVKVPDGGALLFAFSFDPESGQDDGEEKNLENLLCTVADFFGIKEFMFYAQTGSSWLLPEMGNTGAGSRTPSDMQKCSFFTYAQIEFVEESLLGKGIHELFGIKKTELYLGADKEGFIGMITLPEINTSYIKSRDLSLHMQFGKALEFMLKGTFQFTMIPEMEFRIECGVSNSAFKLSALAHADKPVQLIDILSIGDTCLMIQMGKTLEFGLYSTLYINRLAIFGAVMLSETGGTIVPELISAALINELTISSLLENLAGKEMGGNSNIDFIKIKGLDFQTITPFDVKKLAPEDAGAVADHFNRQVDSVDLKLDPEQIQLTSYEAGTDLADLKRMRHYFINKKGNIELSAQFYYSSVDTKFGNYTVEQGLFFCGVLEILKARFEVLFSWRKSEECILAYARAAPIKLGFLTIDSSDFASERSSELPIAADSVMSQFVDLRRRGLVFFLAASKKEVSFYFDGKVDILGIINAQARILFVNGLISIDVCTNFFSILKASLHLKIDYSSFNSGAFQFCLMIDTSGLAEKMKRVTQRIDQAARKLHGKIDNANREITRAQKHVTELYGQISYLDGRINDCAEAIRRAPWWKKAFVAIGKGLEIGAYEVAKGGVYAAIGVATAALEVARAVITFAGRLGEDVLKAVSAVIQGAMSVFYINYIKLEINADRNAANFHAEMGIVLLGKTYTVSKDIGRQALSQNPTGALDDAINSDSAVSKDIENIEVAASRSYWRKYQHEEYTIEENKRNLKEMIVHIDDSVSMLQSMQDSYMQEFHIPMEEFNEMNTSLSDAFVQAENILNTGARTGNMEALDEPMEQLRKIVDTQEEGKGESDNELNRIRESIAQYDEASELHSQLQSAIEKIHESREGVLDYNEKIHDITQENCDIYVNPEGNLAKVITEVEEQMYKTFPVERSGRRLINISRESAIRESFEEAEKMLEVKPSRYVRNKRSLGEKGVYRNRL